MPLDAISVDKMSFGKMLVDKMINRQNVSGLNDKQTKC
jgi:hypothetical protein